MKQKTKKIKIFTLAFALLQLALVYFNGAAIPLAKAAGGTTGDPLSGQVCIPDNSAEGYKFNVARCVNNIYVFSVAIASFIAVIMFVFAGYLYMSGGSENVTHAKQYIQSTIVALLLLFGAYLLLNTIDPNLTSFQLGSLPQNACSGDSCNIITGLPPAPVNNNLGSGTTINAPSDNNGLDSTQGPPPQSPNGYKIEACTSCVQIDNGVLPLKPGQRTSAGGHFLAAGLVSALSALNAKPHQYTWYVSEPWPPTVNHKDECHYKGTCADISLTSDTAALENFCSDIKSVRPYLGITNEYYNLTFPSNSQCGQPRKFETTTAGHLHVYLIQNGDF